MLVKIISQANTLYVKEIIGSIWSVEKTTPSNFVNYVNLKGKCVFIEGDKVFKRAVYNFCGNNYDLSGVKVEHATEEDEAKVIVEAL